MDPSLEPFPAEEELSDDPELVDLSEVPESEVFELPDDAFGPELPDDDALEPESSGLAVDEFPLSLGGGLDGVLLEFCWLLWFEDAF